MKRYFIYAAALIAAVCMAPSCSSDEGISEIFGDGEGAVMLSVATPQAVTTPTTENGEIHIRIYRPNSETKEYELIRHYTGDTAPEQLRLLGGEYRADVTVGEKVDATFDHKFYKGSTPFTVIPGAPTPVEVEVECKRVSVASEVTFDESIGNNFSSASVWVAAATDTDMDKLGKGELVELEYTESKTGYFLLPEGVKSLIYKFEGQHNDTTYPNGGKIVKEGVLTGVEDGVNTELGFKFSPDAPGFITLFEIFVDKSTDDKQDDIIWTDMTITSNFSDSEVNDFIPGKSDENTYTIKSIASLKTIILYVFEGDKETSYTVVANGAATNVMPGVTYDNTNPLESTIKLGADFYAALGGGEKMIRLKAIDNTNGQLDHDINFRIQGLLSAEETDYNLWTNDVTLKALVLDDAATDVKLTFGGQTLDATKGENNIWSATFAAQWEQKTNGSNPSYYQPKSGVFANNDYTFTGSISGIASYKGAFTTNGGDVITNGDMEGSLSCYTTDNTNAAFWGSGNNGIKDALCTAASFTGMQGSRAARMTATSTLGILASGNLFTGTFNMSGTTGYVGFGQKYTYTARPKSLKFKYHAKVGNVNIAKTALIPEGQPDQSSIYVCIIDWSARHTVSSGTGTPTGMWDPSEITDINNAYPDEMESGKIIAYGQMYIDTTTSGSSLIEGEIPLRYYDTECAAPTGNYTIIIACATSRYGDYMNGCDSNVLHVDDFRWGY